MTINKALQSLTVPDEQIELKIVGVYRPRKIKFAFFQKMLDGSRVAFWHVNWKSPNDFGTTLSLEGLKEWGYL